MNKKENTPTAHSRVVGGSTAARVLACPGSIDLAAPMPNTESPAAAEGTALHEAIFWILDGEGRTAADARGRTFYGHMVTEEHERLLDACLDAFQDIVGDKGFELEKSYEFPGIPGAFGTADVCWFDDDEGLLGILDWKFGRGVPVSADANMQGNFYLAGARAEEGAAEGDLQFVIVQPRFEYVGHAAVTHEALDAFEADLHHAVNKGRHAENNLAMGDHCRWCPAMAICPEQQGKMEQLQHLSKYANDVAFILDVATEIEQLVKKAKETAVDMLGRGVAVEGWKLVNKVGTRAWIDEEKISAALGRKGLKTAERYTRKLISPAQAEKLLGKDRVPAGWWEKPDRGTALAPASDKRTAIRTGGDRDKALAEKLRRTI